MNYSIKTYTTIAFCAAILAILAQLTIPIPIIPLTLQTLAVGFIATILPKYQSAACVTLYIFMGAIGIPVYAHFTGGLGILFGPTGGFLLSFPLMAYFISLYLEKLGYTKIHAITANIIGMFMNLIIGTVWLRYNVNITWETAISTGFVPFILVGVVKAILAATIGLTIRTRLKQAKLIAV